MHITTSRHAEEGGPLPSEDAFLLIVSPCLTPLTHSHHEHHSLWQDKTPLENENVASLQATSTQYENVMVP